MNNSNEDMPTVRRVVIAGGGTAGWIAATALSRHLGPLLDITLVESEDIGTIGVGEATIPTAVSFHRLLDIDEREFMRATKSTFKLGIAFENWGALGDRYIHSFGTMGRSVWMGDFHHFWLHGRALGLAGPIGQYCLEHQAAEAGRFAIADGLPLSYAYHLDAALYARFLRARSEAQGVTRIEGRIATVAQHENGDIASLNLDSGRVIDGDLFIDCTGFRGLLIEETLETGYDDWSHWLPTNSAVAMQTETAGDPLPYTRAIAHHAGWQWRIPLQHRMGNGLVYCNDHMTDAEAQALLRDTVSGNPVNSPRVIRYLTGRRRKVWNRNVVALGLSSGFVEPLESTSIHLMMIAVTRLLQMFPFGGMDPALANRFNDLANNEIERVRDFVILHYKQTERDDSPFWRQVRDMAIPDSLAARIALFRESGHAYQGDGDLFRVDSWVQVMLGQRLQPQGYHELGRLLGEDGLRKALNDMQRGVADTVAQLPGHGEFLARYCPPRVV